MAQMVYILYSLKDKKLYVGRTNELYKRLGQHFGGLVKATKNRRPLEIIHKESYKTASEATRRERFLKSLWGGKVKKKILKDFLKSKH